MTSAWSPPRQSRVDESRGYKWLNLDTKFVDLKIWVPALAWMLLQVKITW